MCSESTSCLEAHHQRTAVTVAGPALPHPPVSWPLPCQPFTGHTCAGHWGSQEACHCNLCAGSNGADSKSIPFSVSQRKDQDTWWGLPGTDLAIGGKYGRLLALGPGPPSWGRGCYPSREVCHAPSTSPHPLWFIIFLIKLLLTVMLYIFTEK